MGEVAQSTYNVIKETALVIISKISNSVIKPFKSKQNFKEFVNKVKDKIKGLILRKKEKQETVKKKSKTSKLMSRFGLDADELKTTLRRDAFNLMLFANFNVDRLRFSNTGETSLKEPTKYELFRKDMRIRKQVFIQETY